MTGSRAAADQIELFAAELRQPAGFAYRDGIITAEEEAALAEHFATLPLKPFEFRGYLAIAASSLSAGVTITARARCNPLR